ncbi:MAG: hypothetical protein Q9162_004246 [Coniocarpon cinnabarinum]
MDAFTTGAGGNASMSADPWMAEFQKVLPLDKLPELPKAIDMQKSIEAMVATCANKTEADELRNNITAIFQHIEKMEFKLDEVLAKIENISADAASAAKDAKAAAPTSTSIAISYTGLVTSVLTLATTAGTLALTAYIGSKRFRSMIDFIFRKEPKSATEDIELLQKEKKKTDELVALIVEKLAAQGGSERISNRAHQVRRVVAEDPEHEDRMKEQKKLKLSTGPGQQASSSSSEPSQHSFTMHGALPRHSGESTRSHDDQAGN